MKAKRSLELLKEVITLDNIEPMSEMIAICGIKNLMIYTTTISLDMYKNLYRDIYNKSETSGIIIHIGIVLKTTCKSINNLRN